MDYAEFKHARSWWEITKFVYETARCVTSDLKRNIPGLL